MYAADSGAAAHAEDVKKLYPCQQLALLWAATAMHFKADVRASPSSTRQHNTHQRQMTPTPTPTLRTAVQQRPMKVGNQAANVTRTVLLAGLSTASTYSADVLLQPSRPVLKTCVINTAQSISTGQQRTVTDVVCINDPPGGG